MTGPFHTEMPPRTRAALDEIALLLMAEESSQTVLQKVVDLVQGVLPDGCDVSMTLVRDDRATTAAFTGPRALELDEHQYRAGHGPCLEAATSRQVVVITDGRTETRWPAYVPAFLRAGALSSLSLPVPTAQWAAGLNVYAPGADAFSDTDRRTIARFADYAAVALSNMDALHDAQELAENLRAAMGSRAVIEQAKGILIERHKVTPDGAFLLLVEASQRVNRKVRDLAEQLVRTGELDR